MSWFEPALSWPLLDLWSSSSLLCNLFEQARKFHNCGWRMPQSSTATVFVAYTRETNVFSPHRLCWNNCSPVLWCRRKPRSGLFSWFLLSRINSLIQRSRRSHPRTMTQNPKLYVTDMASLDSTLEKYQIQTHSSFAISSPFRRFLPLGA